MADMAGIGFLSDFSTKIQGFEEQLYMYNTFTVRKYSSKHAFLYGYTSAKVFPKRWWGEAEMAF
jgi:hypothetical protein